MKKLILLLFLVYANGSFAQTKILKTIENDTVLIQIDTLEDVKFGFGRYLNEKMEGNWFFYNENNLPVFSATYSKNVLNGIMYTYFESGLVDATFQYQNGIQSGTNTQFYENGQLYYSYQVKDGLCWGSFTEYNSNGTFRGKYLRFDEIFRDSIILFDSLGKREYVAFFDSLGRKQGEECFYEDGTLTDKYVHLDGDKKEISKYYPNGNLKDYWKMNNNLAHGPCISYYVNGQIKINGDFINDKRNGTWSLYNEQGVLLSETEYLDDIGTRKIYDKKGNLREIGKVYLDERIDKWTYFTKRGKEDYFAIHPTMEEVIAFNRLEE